MGLCGSKEAGGVTIDRPGTGILTVHGDFFSPETRTILVILKLAQVKFNFQLVDQF
jgi:hypothetical protein